MSTATEWLIVKELPDVINCVRHSADDVWCRYVPERHKYTMVIGRVRIGELGGAALEVVSLSCGHMTIDEAGQAPAYCPTCGAKVVDG